MFRLPILLTALVLTAAPLRVAAEEQEAAPPATAPAPSQMQIVPPLAKPEKKDPKEDTGPPSLSTDSLKPGKPELKPYLSEDTAPNTLAILPPPPGWHSPAEAADRAAFNTTRALVGSPRWKLATNDVAEGASALLENFACVLGQRIDVARVPRLIALLDRARLDIARSNRAPKLHYRRLRPFVGNDAPICVEREEKLANSFSYPSGHSAQGWTYAMIMATLMPEKATQFLVRGRLYGESRVVCGVHWMSDVEAARINASAVFATLLGDPGFRADLDRARSELTKTLASEGTKPDAENCARENTAATTPLL